MVSAQACDPHIHSRWILFQECNSSCEAFPEGERGQQYTAPTEFWQKETLTKIFASKAQAKEIKFSIFILPTKPDLPQRLKNCLQKFMDSFLPGLAMNQTMCGVSFNEDFLQGLWRAISIFSVILSLLTSLLPHSLSYFSKKNITVNKIQIK